MLEKDRGSDIDDGQPGPVEHLLAKPLLPLLWRVRHLGEARLRDRHLRDVDQHLQIRALAGHCGRGDRRLQITRRHTHAKVHAPATGRFVDALLLVSSSCRS